MDNDTIIKVEKITKDYFLTGTKPLGKLSKSYLPFGNRAKTKAFRVLDNVSFEIKKGECLGVVGRNGSGKSTLLQVLAGVISADSGTVNVNGTIQALLELGNGMNGEFTGRENVDLAGRLIGLSSKDIDRNISDIIDFAELGEFIDQPVKMFSSGMAMRLAFAINTTMTPDVLLIDEALAVGDAPFQAKCFSRLRDILAKGTSLVLVSHDISTIRTLCQKVLWLKGRSSAEFGESTEICKKYERFCNLKEVGQCDVSHNASSAPSKTELGSSISDERTNYLPTNLQMYGNRKVEIQSLLAFNASSLSDPLFNFGDTLQLQANCKVNENVHSEFIFGVVIKDLLGNNILSACNINKFPNLNSKSGAEFDVSCSLQINLTHKAYQVLIGIFGFEKGLAVINGKYDYGNADLWSVVERAFTFTVKPNTPMPLMGPVHNELDLRMINIEHPKKSIVSVREDFNDF
jgi:lipopolysaccharide transport system ATP-binding protein